MYDYRVITTRSPNNCIKIYECFEKCKEMLKECWKKVG